MENKNYKYLYLKYKHKYSLLKQAYSNDLYTQLGGNPDPVYQNINPTGVDAQGYTLMGPGGACASDPALKPTDVRCRPVLRASPSGKK